MGKTCSCTVCVCVWGGVSPSKLGGGGGGGGDGVSACRRLCTFIGLQSLNTRFLIPSLSFIRANFVGRNS